jgi:hypothetical protein
MSNSYRSFGGAYFSDLLYFGTRGLNDEGRRARHLQYRKHFWLWIRPDRRAWGAKRGTFMKWAKAALQRFCAKNEERKEIP